MSEYYKTRFMKWYGLPRPCYVVYSVDNNKVVAICSSEVDANNVKQALDDWINIPKIHSAS